MNEKIIILERLRTFYEGLQSLIEGYVQDVKDYVDSKVGEGVDLSNYATKDYVGNARLVFKDAAGNVVDNSFTANKSGADVSVEIPAPMIISVIKDNPNTKDEDESEAEKNPSSLTQNGSIELKFLSTGRSATFAVYGVHISTPQKVSGTTAIMHVFYFSIDVSNLDFHNLTGIVPTQGGVYWLYARGANVNNRMFGQDVMLNDGHNLVKIHLLQSQVNGNIVNGRIIINADICFNRSFDLNKLQAEALSNFRGHLTLRNNP